MIRNIASLLLLFIMQNIKYIIHTQKSSSNEVVMHYYYFFFFCCSKQSTADDFNDIQFLVMELITDLIKNLHDLYNDR